LRQGDDPAWRPLSSAARPTGRSLRGSIYLTSRSGSWRIHSASHWTERYALFVLIVLGESLVAVGVGAAEHPISVALLLAAGLGVGFAICLWWLYFDLVAPATERRVAELDGAKRVRLALEAYVYGHFPLIAGVVIAAVGVEGALQRFLPRSWRFPALLALACVTVLLGGPVVFERVRFAELRDQYRGG
jgi:low temperature requirement protein LtrA